MPSCGAVWGSGGWRSIPWGAGPRSGSLQEPRFALFTLAFTRARLAEGKVSLFPVLCFEPCAMAKTPVHVQHGVSLPLPGVWHLWTSLDEGRSWAAVVGNSRGPHGEVRMGLFRKHQHRGGFLMAEDRDKDLMRHLCCLDSS